MSEDVAWVAGRYRVEEALGHGGMGAVYRVFDTIRQRPIALKRLSAEALARKPHLGGLFRREYQMLVQLAHPRIIEVYDYGIDSVGPYYTMELLDGSDFRELAPLDWRRACALCRDVASSLAIMHSRRLLHRDVSPRNVRCTADGRAKLLDFGAMTSMGIPDDVVGTPAFTPPEALNNQPLDGRADLYALGALAYWLLTRRNAYPARTLVEVKDAWRSRPRPPSAYAPDIPEALDRLVMRMLSLDPLRRPATAAEVIDRLHAIAELPAADHVDVAQAYLTTPTLVGRCDVVNRFRKHMIRAMQGRGGAIMVEGEAGMGRSRLLASYVLEAKLIGAYVLRADARSASGGDYGFVQRLAEELIETLPEVAIAAAQPHAGLLLHALPALAEPLGHPPLEPFDDATQRRPRVQMALRAWFVAVAQRRCLTLAVDDVQQCDEPSAALLAALAHDAHRQRLVLVTTRDTGAVAVAPGAVDLLGEAGGRVRLAGLNAEQTEALLRSVFGDVPRLNSVASWVHEHAKGVPRTCMDLAQHLVDHGMARYAGGAWTLPADLDALNLPESLEQALDARLASLGPDARALAEALSLVTPYAPLSIAEYTALLPAGEDVEGRLFEALDALVSAQVLVGGDDGYGFTQRGLIEALQRGMDEARCQALHRELAALYARIRPDDPMTVAHHLRLAGDEAGMLEAVLRYRFGDEQAEDAPHRVLTWMIPCFEAGLEACDRVGRPPVERLRLLRGLLMWSAIYEPSLVRYADETLARLRHAAGLDLLEGADGDLDPAPRLQQALMKAQARYDAAPEHERTLPPLKAIKCLALAVTHVASACGGTFDFARMRKLPALVEPLRSLSPAIDILWRIIDASVRRAHAQHNPALADTIARLQQPIPGLSQGVGDGTARVLSFYLASEEAVSDPSAARRRADWLEQHPNYAALAWHVRMLTCLYAGELARATECRERRDVMAMQGLGSLSQLLTGMAGEARAHARCGDLMQLKQLIEPIARHAERYVGWRPVLYCVQGDYYRLRGELAQAKEMYERALALTAAGEHSQWPSITLGYLETLLLLDESQRARSLAEQALRECASHGLKATWAAELETLLALAEAKLGCFEQALARLEPQIVEAEAAATSRVALGSLYEARARIALWAGDHEAFRKYAELTERQYRMGGHPALVDKHARLLEEAGPVAREDDDLEDDEAQFTTTSDAAPRSVHLRTQLEQCQGATDRAQCALSLLLEQLGASEGFLYLLQDGVPCLAAPGVGAGPPAGLDAYVENYLRSELTLDSDHTMADSVADAATDGLWKSRSGVIYRPVLLSSVADGELLITGVAMLRCEQAQSAAAVWDCARMVSDQLLASGDLVPGRATP